MLPIPNFVRPFLHDWLETRDFRDLRDGIPAAIAGLFLLIGVLICSIPVEPMTLDVCVDEAIRAVREGDPNLAGLYLRKARLAEGASDVWQFRQALVLERLGQQRETALIMQRLAPLDQPGHVPAHQWMIQRLTGQFGASMKREQETPAPEDLKLRQQITAQIERHAELILEVEPDDAMANERLALIRLGQQDLQSASEYLSKVVDQNEELRVIYAQISSKLGATEESRAQAEKAIEYHRKKLDELAQDEASSGTATDSNQDPVRWNHLLRLSQALLVTEQWEAAATNLLDGNRLPSDPVKRRALSEVLYLWSESITDADATSLIRKMNLLDRALQLRPNDPMILQRIADLANEQGVVGERARKELKSVLASGQASGLVHTILGVQAIIRENSEAALAHWELAHRANPNTPITLNNLAVLISRQDPPNLRRALQLINQAIELKPEVAEFYDSRGQIYLLQDDYTNAIADFEHAISRLPGRADIHKRLSKAYEGIGDDELAAIHRERAEQVGGKSEKEEANKKQTDEKSGAS